MFLCKQCHPKKVGLICGINFDMERLSLGKCESCDKTRPCVDCHCPGNVGSAE